MQLIGHQQKIEFLKKEVTDQRLSQAYLVYGVEGIGKRLALLFFAQWLFCTADDDSNELSLLGDSEPKLKPCGECSSCKKIENSQHPDLFLIEAENKRIKIDSIRQLQKSLTRAPMEASYKFVIINDAHLMTLQASNSLLKTLEEPPKDTLIFLISPNLFQILPTIRSRSRRLFFTSPPTEELVPLLKEQWGVDEKVARQYLKTTDGSPGLSYQLTEENFSKAIDSWNQLSQQKKRSFNLIHETVDEMIKLDVDLSLLLEVLKKRLFTVMEERDQWGRIEHIDAMNRAQVDIKRNVNKTLVLENLFINILGM